MTFYDWNAYSVFPLSLPSATKISMKMAFHFASVLSVATDWYPANIFWYIACGCLVKNHSHLYNRHHNGITIYFRPRFLFLMFQLVFLLPSIQLYHHPLPPEYAYP